MKKFIIYSLLIFAVILSANGNVYSANEYFRSIASGNWNSLSTWEMSTNSGSTWIPASIIPDSTSGIIEIRLTHTVTVTANASADQLSIISNSTLSINSGIEFTFVNGNLTLISGNTISGDGTFKTMGSVAMNIRNGSTFSADLKVNTGTTSATDYGSPYIGRFYGDVTVDSGANLEVTNGGYDLEVYGTLLNNGTISGTGTSKLIVRGSSLVNNNSMMVGHLAFDTASAITGAGSYTNGTIFINASGNVSLGNNVTFSPASSFTINNGGIFDPNNFTFTLNSGTLLANPGSTLLNSGIFMTQGAVDLNIRGGSNFNTNLKVNTGITRGYDSGSPWIGKLFGNVTVDAGAELQVPSSGYFMKVFGNVTNNGVISGPNSTFIMSGPSLVNNSSMTSTNFNMDSVTSISGAGTFTNNTILVAGSGIVSLATNLTVSPLNYFAVDNGGVLNPNAKIFTINAGSFIVNPTGTVSNSGQIRTQGTVTMNIRNNSNFNADLKVNTGTTKVYDSGSPYTGKIYGNVTVDASAVLEVFSGGYFMQVFGNVINNGSITGSSSTFIMSGPSLVNNNSISSAAFNMDSTTSISGAGSFTSNEIHIMGTGNVKLLSNITVSPVNYFAVNNTGSILNPNSFTFKINSGTFYANPGSIVENSGKVRTEGTVTLNIRNTSLFKAPLEVATGTTQIYDSGSPYIARMYGSVTLFGGTTLSVVSGYHLELYANLFNSGTITGPSANPLYFAGKNQLFQGSGSVLGHINIKDSSVVTMGSNHILNSININTGGTYKINNYKVSFSASNPISQNGTFITTNGKVEYNGTALQTVSTSNIVYGGLIVNNSAGATMPGNVTVNDTISLMQGDLDLNGQVITLSSAGYLKETPGNILYGSPGYITITRNTGTPSSMNVGGLGAVLTANADLGSTEVRRGHTVQTGLDGGTSIKRYYDIMPTNNTDLHASLVYKYDESELNGKPEASLKLFKSTNTGSTWQFMGGTVNTVANEITIVGLNSFSRWAADTSGLNEATAVIMEGFYDIANNRLNMTDTVRFYLRNSASPYALVDSAIVTIDSITFNAQVQFANASTGQYYLQVKHRNSLDTWSKDRIKYIAGSMFNYDFTLSADQAYGDNEVLKGTKYCMYSGDITQDGYIDLNDVVGIYNNAAAFVNGYVVTDVNGDRITDLADILIAYNNAIAFVSAKSPINP